MSLFRKKTAPATDLFSPAWILMWKDAINRDETYRKEARNWNQSVLLAFQPAPDILLQHNALGFFLDLQYGECHDLRYAEKNDEDTTDIILEGSHDDWLQLLKKGGDPMMMIMKKKIRLKKGGLVWLSTQRKAAAALLATAPVPDEQGVYVGHDGVAGHGGHAQHGGGGRPRAGGRHGGSGKHGGSGRHGGHASRKTPNISKRDGFVTTGGGLDRESVPMALFQKSKTLGIWNPVEIDLTEDIKQWNQFTSREKGILHHLSAMFMAGEEAVTLDLLPLIRTVASEGRVEEEIYLTSFLWEEAKHTEFFDLYMKEVMGAPDDLASYHGPMYKIIFYEKLPNALNALWSDASPAAQLKASATYNMIVEGTLAETGYEAYFNMLEDRDLLPGLRQGITLLKRDESRHIAFALHFLSRILREHPSLTGFLEEELGILLGDATNVVHEIFDRYGDDVPFGLSREWFLNYAIKQFQNRIHKLGLDV